MVSLTSYPFSFVWKAPENICIGTNTIINSPKANSCFSDSNIYDITATWVAHEPDEWSIRSGPLDIAFDQRQTKDVKLTSDFTFPMKEKPAQLFYAFSHIDVEPDRNLQVDLYANCDEKRVYAEFHTWDNE